MKELRIEAEAQLGHLATGLRAVLAERQVTAAQASAMLGKSPSYFSRVLAGKLEAKVGEVFELLFHLEVPGDYFFAKYYAPLGPPVPGGPAGGLAPGVCDHWDGEIWCDWVRRQLLVLANERGLTLRDVARAVGRPPDALSRALHGRTQLTFRLVFGALAAVGLPPWRFFFRAAVPQRHVVPAVTWDELLEVVGLALDGPPLPASLSQPPGGSRRSG